jgi:hypothetical protein
MNKNPAATGPSSSIFRFAAINPLRSGTLYFITEAGRDEFLTNNPAAFAVDGSPASHADRLYYY